MVKTFCNQLMSVVLVLAICHGQMDYFFVYKMGSTKNTMSKNQTLTDLTDGDDESSDQDESQKEGKSYPLYATALPRLDAIGNKVGTSSCRFGRESERWLSNHYLDAIYQPPRWA